MTAHIDARPSQHRKPSLFVTSSFGIVALLCLYVLSSGPFYAKLDFKGPAVQVYKPLWWAYVKTPAPADRPLAWYWQQFDPPSWRDAWWTDNPMSPRAREIEKELGFK